MATFPQRLIDYYAKTGFARTEGWEGPNDEMQFYAGNILRHHKSVWRNIWDIKDICSLFTPQQTLVKLKYHVCRWWHLALVTFLTAKVGVGCGATVWRLTAERIWLLTMIFHLLFLSSSDFSGLNKSAGLVFGSLLRVTTGRGLYFTVWRFVKPLLSLSTPTLATVTVQRRPGKAFSRC